MSEASLIDAVHEQNTTLRAQLRACKREKRRMFAALCKGCQYHGSVWMPYCRQTNGDCVIRACPLLKKGGGK